MIAQPDLRATIVAFLRRKLLFALVLCLVCGAGAGYLMLAQTLWQSTASLVVRFDTRTVPDIDRNRDPTQPPGSNERREIIYSDADMLHARDVIVGTINSVGLARLYPKIAARAVSNSAKLEAAEQQFGSNLVIDVGLQSDVITVTYLNSDPLIAHDAVQQLLKQFYAQEAAVYANPQLHFSDDEASKARAKLTEAQNTLAAFKAKNNIADLQQQVMQLLTQRTDVGTRLNIAHARVVEAEQRQAALEQLLKNVPSEVSASAAGEQYHAVDAAETQLDELLTKRSQMASTYQPDSPVFQQLDAQIASLKKIATQRTQEAKGRAASTPNVVRQNIDTDYLRASAEATSARQPEQVLAAQLQSIEQQLSTLEAERNQYDDMVRTVQIQNDTYRALAIRYETARVEANRNAQNISAAAVIAAPSTPDRPARPRRKLVALATLLAGLILATCAVLLIEAIDDRLAVPRDVVRTLRLPVLATFDTER
jgi:succinoglycan biosynthesis transport protein ExoP